MTYWKDLAEANRKAADTAMEIALGIGTELDTVNAFFSEMLRLKDDNARMLILHSRILDAFNDGEIGKESMESLMGVWGTF